MKLLIHTCCADCALHLLTSLETETVKPEKVTLYFYNPNIHPQEEYYARLRALKLVFADKRVKLVVPHWSPKEYFAKVKSAQGRCPICWELRLTRTFEYAKEQGYDAVTSTMLTSHYLNREMITQFGAQLAKQFKIKFFVPTDAGSELKTKGFYKQNYCGCVFSLMERYTEKFLD